jgi:hypothetical protein
VLGPDLGLTGLSRKDKPTRVEFDEIQILKRGRASRLVINRFDIAEVVDGLLLRPGNRSLNTIYPAEDFRESSAANNRLCDDCVSKPDHFTGFLACWNFMTPLWHQRTKVVG